MGATKLQFYTEHQIEMARLCKSLGHPARIALIEALIENKHLNCNDLRFYVPLAQSTISRHLKELYEAGVLGYNNIYNNTYYYINKKVLSDIIEYLTKINLSTHTINSFVYFKPKINNKKPFFMRV